MANEVNTYLQPTATKTASYTGTPINLPASGGPRRGYIFKLTLNNVGGTTPTLGATIQLSRDGGTTWLTYSTFVNRNSATTDTFTGQGEFYAHLHDDDIVGTGNVYPHQIRLNVVIGGTTPTFDVTAAQVVAIPG